MCAGLGVVPLPDTAIDFSDLRSQSSRMNERVSCRILGFCFFFFLDILLHPCHEAWCYLYILTVFMTIMDVSAASCVAQWLCAACLVETQVLSHKCQCWNDVYVINLLMTKDTYTVTFSGLRGVDGVQPLWNLQATQSAPLPRLPEVYPPHGPPLPLVRSIQRSLLSTSFSSHLLPDVCVLRINNCVGELNQKYFIQFLFYTGEKSSKISNTRRILMIRMHAFNRLSVLAAGMASLYSLVLVVSSWVWRIRNERESDTEKEGEETPSKHLIVWVLVWTCSSRASLHYCYWTA